VVDSLGSVVGLISETAGAGCAAGSTTLGGGTGGCSGAGGASAAGVEGFSSTAFCLSKAAAAKATTNKAKIFKK
jgi:hypothetical protein